MNSIVPLLMFACLAPIPKEAVGDQHAPGFFGMHMVPDGNSVKVTSVLENSAAERSGLKPEDVLKKLGDWEIDGIEHLRETITSMRPGTKIPIAVLRKGATVTLTIQVGAMP